MQSKRECEVSGWQPGGGRAPPVQGAGAPGAQARWGGRRGGAPFPPACSPQLWCERVNPENKAALEAWVRETGIRLVQVNGQRKYGGPPPGTIVPAGPDHPPWGRERLPGFRWETRTGRYTPHPSS